ncbi:MAG: hypothetical protein IKF38_00380 [Clostridia bacterium]|nr:hypothetical protein [Clostridia bacterium]
MKQEKGITLIALVITIIVLLILAGVTIAMLSGSDSTPAKANEAAQKNDIGTAKDQVYMWAQDAQSTAYVTAYVNSSSTSTTSAGVIGQSVASALKTKIGTSFPVGKATITVQSTGSDGSYTAFAVKINTTDYEVTGTVDLTKSGVISWENPANW